MKKVMILIVQAYIFNENEKKHLSKSIERVKVGFIKIKHKLEVKKRYNIF